MPVANLADHVATLAAAGADEFLVPNLPPLGQTPAHYGSGSETAMDNLTIEFNDELSAELDALETTLDVTIHRLDVFALFERVLADPAAFGFTNVTDEAYNGGSPVPNPDEYLFWDPIHPSAAGHAWLGQLAVRAVPEPSVLVLLAAAARAAGASAGAAQGFPDPRASVSDVVEPLPHADAVLPEAPVRGAGHRSAQEAGPALPDRLESPRPRCSARHGSGRTTSCSRWAPAPAR